jgi:aromatic ring hydroxylase
MGIRTGKELLESLRDDRKLFIDGERVSDVTADPRFAEAARSLAALYDMQHDPALAERMTFRSPASGEPLSSRARSTSLSAAATWSRSGWTRAAACSAAAPIS